MTRGTTELANKLLSQIHTAKTLKMVSDTLEELTKNKSFKEHGINIATDPNLTNSQKKTQLLYLIRSIEIPLLYSFFVSEFDENKFWLFAGGRIDYFDRFVQEFQKATESIELVTLETAVDVDPITIKKISQQLTNWFGIQCVINHQKNPSILGGVKIQVENVLYDYSLHSRFLQFQHAWIKSLKDTNKKIGRNIPQ